MTREVPAVYALHGLAISSPIRLHAPTVDDRLADLRIVVEPFDAGPTANGERCVLRYEHAEGIGLEVTHEANGYLFRYHHPCRFLVSTDLTTVTVWADDDAGWALAAVLLEGWVLAFVLQMLGHCVLHASAVVVDGSALALVGNSGMGKSTLAALLSMNEASFFADDVLRVELDGSTPVAHAGSAAARLRPAAFGLADQFAPDSSTPTTDGRLAIQPSNGGFHDRVPLSAILIPWPSRDVDDVSISWLEPPVALHTLSQYPRIYEWQIREPIRQQFSELSALVEVVPVGDLVVPWGPPWRPEVAASVVRQLAHRPELKAPRS